MIQTLYKDTQQVEDKINFVILIINNLLLKHVKGWFVINRMFK